jgi:hypothetical protein
MTCNSVVPRSWLSTRALHKGLSDDPSLQLENSSIQTKFQILLLHPAVRRRHQEVEHRALQRHVVIGVDRDHVQKGN